MVGRKDMELVVEMVLRIEMTHRQARRTHFVCDAIGRLVGESSAGRSALVIFLTLSTEAKMSLTFPSDNSESLME